MLFLLQSNICTCNCYENYLEHRDGLKQILKSTIGLKHGKDNGYQDDV